MIASVCALWRREWQGVVGSGTHQAVLLWLPLALTLLMLWMFSGPVASPLPVIWMDQDNTTTSRQLGRVLSAAPALELIQGPTYMAETASWLERQQAYAVIWLPSGFEQGLLSQQGGQVTLLHNAQLANHSSQIHSAVSQGVAVFNAGAEMSAYQRQGLTAREAEAWAMPVQVETQILGNASMSNGVFLMVPLTLAMLSILIMVATVSAVGRELRTGSAQRWLVVAGSPTVAIVGKLSFYSFWAIGLVWVTLLGLGMFVDHFRASAALWLASALFALAAVGAGALLIAATLNWRMALSLTGFYAAPAFAFAGQAYPLVSMPSLAQFWAALLPLTHWLEVYHRSALLNATSADVASSLLNLMMFALIPMLLGILLLRHRAFDSNRWGAI